MQALEANDPYWPNYPPKGALAGLPTIGFSIEMLTGDCIGPPDESVVRNTVSTGPTGHGKTTLQKYLVEALVYRGYLVICFDRKSEYQGLATVAGLRDKTTVLDLSDLMLVYGQPPPGVNEKGWATAMCSLTGRCHGRLYPHRLLDRVFEELRWSAAASPGRPTGPPVSFFTLLSPEGHGLVYPPVAGSNSVTL